MSYKIAAPAPITPDPITTVPDTTGTISIEGIVGNIVGWVYYLVSAAALLALIYGAFLYITAGGDAEKTTKARNVIMYALLGVFVVAAAGILINFATGGDLFDLLVN